MQTFSLPVPAAARFGMFSFGFDKSGWTAPTHPRPQTRIADYYSPSAYVPKQRDKAIVAGNLQKPALSEYYATKELLATDIQKARLESLNALRQLEKARAVAGKTSDKAKQAYNKLLQQHDASAASTFEAAEASRIEAEVLLTNAKRDYELKISEVQRCEDVLKGFRGEKPYSGRTFKIEA